MNKIQSAVFDLIYEFPGGVEAAAARLGKAVGTVRHEAKPPEGGSAKAGLLDVNKLMHHSGDLRVLHALCEDHGGMFLPLAAHVETDSEDARAALAKMGQLAKEFGDVMTEASAALADGRITDNDLMKVQHEWRDLVACGSQLVGLLATINAQLPR